MSRRALLYTLILILLTLTPFSSTQSNQKTLPQAVIDYMATREERHHHFLWHNIRENWLRFNSSTQQQLRDLGWAPPRPGRQFDSQGNSIAILDNNSGEDFFYMHRQMIAQVNNILATNGGSYGTHVTGWTSVPAPGNSVWPVPSTYTIPDSPTETKTVNNWKTTSFYNNNIKPTDQRYKNPAQLRQMTLGELGARIDVTIHGWMHLRFSASSNIYRPPVSVALPIIDKIYDNPSYDWLVDTYSSHVNPAFWKLHGWIDNRIEDWRKANGLSSINWVGTWTGGPMSSVSYLWDNKEASTSLRVNGHGHGDPNPEKGESVWEKVAKIVAQEGFDTNFADPVFLVSPMKSAGKPKIRRCLKKPSRKNR